MSTMPEGDAAGQQGGGQHGTHPGAPQQAGAPGQEHYRGASGGPVPAQPQGPGPSADQGGQPGRAAPATRLDTRVTGRRVVQYLIDSFLVGIIPALASIPFDRSDSTFVHILGGIVAFGIFVLVGLLYWVVFTYAQHGQTLGMKLLGLRVISMGGGPANRGQLTIRWLCLILDAIPYTWPFTGLLGYIVILCSRNRQRIGDHLARTLVVATRGTVGGPQYADGAAQYPGTGPGGPPVEPR
jgi:uncharacterized RDD family membrane protein YckC